MKSKDPDRDIGVGNIFIYETEASKTAELVDVIVFHDYSSTRKRLREALEYAKKWERNMASPYSITKCAVLQELPYDMSIELHNEYQTGWYLFELMIGKDMWSRVHGVVLSGWDDPGSFHCFPISGFFRNRV